MVALSPDTIDVTKRDTSSRPLTGRWLLAARTVWIIVTVLSIGTLALDLPRSYLRFHTLCTEGVCESRLTPAQAVLIGQLGISADAYGSFAFVIALLTIAIYLVVAWVIFWRRSRDPLALMISLALSMTGGLITGQGYDPLIAIYPAMRWVIWILNTGSFLLTIAGGYLMPSGSFVPRWAKFPLIIGGVGMIITSRYLVPIVPTSPPLSILFDPSLGTAAGISLALGMIASQVYRYRRVSTPSEKQQTKWIVIGFAVPFLTWITFLAFYNLTNKQTSVVQLLFTTVLLPVASLGFPLSIFFSMLRYRLWDIDFVINRSLVYIGVTVLLGGVFAGAFFALRAIVESILGSQQAILAAVVSTVIVIVLFNPTRQWLRRQVDQHLYGIKLNYVEAVKVYGGTKRESRKTGETRDSFGGYTGLTLLGKGGMGEVYLAQHPTLNRSVAIKILPEHKGGDEAEKRFQREAQTVAKLKHSNIVTLHDVGEQDGQPYMVMEYIDGQDLSDVLRQRGQLPVNEALAILRDVASALDYAHSQGVIHRDIKPSNVMVETNPTPTLPLQGEGVPHRAVLMDFGIAKSYAATRLTQSGGMIGTLDYISPEQIQGAADVDARADIYSFGVMAYQVLTGKLPFAHNNPGAMVLAHLNQPPPDPRESVSDLPDSAAIAVMRAMSKKPDQRFDTAGAFVAAMA